MIRYHLLMSFCFRVGGGGIKNFANNALLRKPQTARLPQNFTLCFNKEY